MNRHALFLADGTSFVNRVAEYIHNATQRFNSYWNRNRRFGVLHAKSAANALRSTHGNGTHNAVAKLLLNFKR